MPCFFVITGYCSHFNKPFSQFLISSCKTIFLPSVTLSILIIIVSSNLTFVAFANLGKDIILYGGRYWFLSALFIARILYWICNQFNYKTKYALCVFSFCIGYILSMFYHGREYWWFIHSLLLMPYLGIGQALNSFEIPSVKLLSVALGIFMISTIALAYFGILHIDYYYHVPGITQKLLNNNFTMFVPLIILSVVGSLWLISVSKVMDSNKVLEYLGRNSLIIYCIHGTILSCLIPQLVGGGIMDSLNFVLE